MGPMRSTTEHAGNRDEHIPRDTDEHTERDIGSHRDSQFNQQDQRCHRDHQIEMKIDSDNGTAPVDGPYIQELIADQTYIDQWNQIRSPVTQTTVINYIFMII